MQSILSLLAWLPISLMMNLNAQAQTSMVLANGSEFIFASKAQGKAILSQRDDYVRRMSSFDRSVRLKTEDPVSENAYLDFVRSNVLSWNDQDRQTVTDIFLDIKQQLNELSLPLPKQTVLILSTGQEEGGAAYTRGNAIVLPKSYLLKSAADLTHIFSHEIFHVLSRNDPKLRNKLYHIIGFHQFDELVFPLQLQGRKITNPDAPFNEFYIRVRYLGKAQWVIPILFSNRPYDAVRRGSLFDYLQLKFLLVKKNKDSNHITSLYDGQQLQLVDPDLLAGFYEQIGHNTTYILHPEEILAENFALLVTSKPDLPSPWILKKMQQLLATDRH